MPVPNLSSAAKYLAIELSPESKALVQKLATHSEIRGEHVTLAYDSLANFSPNWIPGSYVDLCCDRTILQKSLLVEISTLEQAILIIT